MHDVVIVGIPLVALSAGILFQRNDVKEPCGGIAQLRSRLREESAVDADLRQFFHVTGKLAGRIDEIATR